MGNTLLHFKLALKNRENQGRKINCYKYTMNSDLANTFEKIL